METGYTYSADTDASQSHETPMTPVHHGYTPFTYDVSWRRPRVSMFKALHLLFKNFVNFRGRAGRSEFWKPLLTCVLISVALAITTIILYLTLSDATIIWSRCGEYIRIDMPNKPGYDECVAANSHLFRIPDAVFGTIWGVWMLTSFVIFPLVLSSVAVRRLHDIGLSGLLILIPPAIIGIFFLVVLVFNSTLTNESRVVMGSIWVSIIYIIPTVFLLLLASGSKKKGLKYQPKTHQVAN